jgi:hypothetical protein
MDYEQEFRFYVGLYTLNENAPNICEENKKTGEDRLR